jgi:hypothetical protein
VIVTPACVASVLFCLLCVFVLFFLCFERKRHLKNQAFTVVSLTQRAFFAFFVFALLNIGLFVGEPTFFLSLLLLFFIISFLHFFQFLTRKSPEKQIKQQREE